MDDGQVWGLVDREIQQTNFQPDLSVYYPDGSLVARHTALTTAEISFEVTVNGVYTIWATEVGSDHTGPYYLSLSENASSVPGDSTPLAPGLELGQNYPNPFNPNTIIGYMLPKRGEVHLDIFNVAGERVRTLLSGVLVETGQHQMQWDGLSDQGDKAGSGLYFYRIRTQDSQLVKRMMLIK